MRGSRKRSRRSITVERLHVEKLSQLYTEKDDNYKGHALLADTLFTKYDFVFIGVFSLMFAFFFFFWVSAIVCKIFCSVHGLWFQISKYDIMNIQMRQMQCLVLIYI